MRVLSVVSTTGLVCGLCVRGVESGDSDDCDGDEVIEDANVDVEGGTELIELLSREVVEGVWDGGPEVEEGTVGVGS